MVKLDVEGIIFDFTVDEFVVFINKTKSIKITRKDDVAEVSNSNVVAEVSNSNVYRVKKTKKKTGFSSKTWYDEERKTAKHYFLSGYDFNTIAVKLNNFYKNNRTAKGVRMQLYNMGLTKISRSKIRKELKNDLYKGD